MDTDTLVNKIWDETILFEEIDDFFVNAGDKSEIIISLLEVALRKKSGSAVEYLLYAAQKNGVSTAYENILCSLLEIREYWMYKHEDVATLLGKIGSDKSVGHLCRLAQDYKTSDIHNIPLKAIWALYGIGTVSALKCLRMISRSDDLNKAKVAMQLADNFDNV